MSSRARCGLTRAATVTPASRTRFSASASSAVSIGTACSSCRRATAVSGESAAAETTRASAASASACRAHNPSALSTASPPSCPMRTALAGDTTASDGCVTSGIENG